MAIRRLSFLDRRGGLLGRSRWQRRRHSVLLCLRIGVGRLRCDLGRAGASRRRLRRRRRPGFRARCRLQGLRRLRHLRIANDNHSQRKAGQRNPRRDHDGCQQQIVPQAALFVVQGHSIHRDLFAGLTDVTPHRSPGNRQAKRKRTPARLLESGRYSSSNPASPSSSANASIVPLLFQASAETGAVPFLRTRISAPSFSRTIRMVPSL
jgi:hypothetical protein